MGGCQNWRMFEDDLIRQFSVRETDLDPEAFDPEADDLASCFSFPTTKLVSSWRNRYLRNKHNLNAVLFVLTIPWGEYEYLKK